MAAVTTAVAALAMTGCSFSFSIGGHSPERAEQVCPPAPAPVTTPSHSADLPPSARIPSTEQFESGELRLSEVDSERLEQLRQDLLRRRDYDLQQHGGMPGPDAAYLDAWIWKVTQELNARSGKEE
jgi:hypothetical protein